MESYGNCHFGGNFEVSGNDDVSAILYAQQGFESDDQYFESSIPVSAPYEPTDANVGNLLHTDAVGRDNQCLDMSSQWLVPFPSDFRNLESHPGSSDDTASPPVTRGTTTLAFDLDRVTDEKLKSRIIRNRASAERSRQRRKGALKGMEEMTEQLEGECAGLRSENGALRRQLDVLQVPTRRF
jgi:hypothetical protein